ncbi:predicted protein [Postia placenta Mad-698-R]|nr:predicted protein [Postia placenta Mad-698-R]
MAHETGCDTVLWFNLREVMLAGSLEATVSCGAIGDPAFDRRVMLYAFMSLLNNLTLALARRLTSVRPLRPTEVNILFVQVMSPADTYEITLGSNESPVSRLPKLAEDGSNWVLFKAQFKATVSSKGLLRFLEGRDKIPIEPTAPGVDSDADEKEA